MDCVLFQELDLYKKPLTLSFRGKKKVENGGMAYGIGVDTLRAFRLFHDVEIDEIFLPFFYFLMKSSFSFLPQSLFLPFSAFIQSTRSFYIGLLKGVSLSARPIFSFPGNAKATVYTFPASFLKRKIFVARNCRAGKYFRNVFCFQYKLSG